MPTRQPPQPAAPPEGLVSCRVARGFLEEGPSDGPPQQFITSCGMVKFKPRDPVVCRKNRVLGSGCDSSRMTVPTESPDVSVWVHFETLACSKLWAREIADG